MYCTLLYCTLLYFTRLYCTVLLTIHSTVLYSTVPFRDLLCRCTAPATTVTLFLLVHYSEDTLLIVYNSDASSGQMSPSSSGVSSLGKTPSPPSSFLTPSSPGTSWSSLSPTLTPPFPLPPTEDDPVEALLQLSQNGREALAQGEVTVSTTIEAMESDEGIVSDQSNEFEDKKRIKVKACRRSFSPLPTFVHETPP